MPVLAYDDVHKSYGRAPALSGVSLEVQAGEVFGLLGPNGAGKTTLIRIGLDILRADRGTVTLFGERASRALLDRVSYLPEERGLYQGRLVLDVLVYFGRLKGLSARDARRRGEHWLERVGLPDVGKRKVATLSKGMGQKVQIAAALLAEPELCVLDEPFSGLDPVAVELVKGLIHERRRAGLATILSTHMMNQVEAVCDRVALVSHGRRVVYGPIAEVRRAHSQPEVRVSLAGGALPELSLVTRVVPEADGTLLLVLGGGVTHERALAALVGAGARVERFEPVLASMERIFIDVVRDAETRVEVRS